MMEPCDKRTTLLAVKWSCRLDWRLRDTCTLLSHSAPKLHRFHDSLAVLLRFSFAKCPFCIKAKKELTDMGVPFTALDLDQMDQEVCGAGLPILTLLQYQKRCSGCFLLPMPGSAWGAHVFFFFFRTLRNQQDLLVQLWNKNTSRPSGGCSPAVGLTSPGEGAPG